MIADVVRQFKEKNVPTPEKVPSLDATRARVDAAVRMWEREFSHLENETDQPGSQDPPNTPSSAGGYVKL